MSRQGIDRCPHCNARWVDGCANADRCNALDAEDLRAQIEQQAETIRKQDETIQEQGVSLFHSKVSIRDLNQCVLHLESVIEQLRAQLEGRAKGTEQ